MASTCRGASLWASASEQRLVAWGQLQAPGGRDAGDRLWIGAGALCVCVGGEEADLFTHN